MKKIVLVLMLSFGVFAVNAQTCDPDLVVDDVEIGFDMNRVVFVWSVPSSGGGGVITPPPPPGLLTYNIQIEWGADDPNGGITWGLFPENYNSYVQGSVGKQAISVPRVYRLPNHIRIRIEFLSGNCTNSWSQWFEYSLY